MKKKKKLQYLGQLVGVQYCGIFYQEITSDLRVKEMTLIIIMKIMAIMTKNIKLIINVHLLKIAMVMFQLKIKLMIPILLLEVRNLKNITKLTITIVIIMKTITTLKVVVMIKIIAPRRHHPQKKLFSYLEEAW